MDKEQQSKERDAPATPQRNYVIPGVETYLSSSDEGMLVDQFLAIVFSIAAANPEAKVSFGLTIKDPDRND